jgi:N-acetylneuraminic acid mutarotase
MPDSAGTSDASTGGAAGTGGAPPGTPDGGGTSDVSIGGAGGTTDAGGSGGTGGAGGTAGSGGMAGAGGTAGSGGTTGSGGTAGSGGMVDAGDTRTPPIDAGDASDPPPGGYGRRADLPLANSEMAVAELDGKIYVLGGYPASRVPQASVQIYDPKIDQWTMAAPLPLAMHHPVVTGVNGKLYSFGGQLTSGDTPRTLAYDPGLNTWADLANMPTARGAGASAVIGEKVYIAGGRPPGENAFEVYDIPNNSWVVLPDLPPTYPNRNHIAATAIDGKIYVAGGRYNGGSFSDPITDSLDMFDPAAGAWVPRARMLRPRGGVNGIAANGCFFVWGGEGAASEPNGVFPDHDVYNPKTDQWRALARLPTPIHGVTGVAFIDGIIYIPGGGTVQGGSSGSTIFQVYRPDMRCD